MHRRSRRKSLGKTVRIRHPRERSMSSVDGRTRAPSPSPPQFSRSDFRTTVSFVLPTSKHRLADGSMTDNVNCQQLRQDGHNITVRSPPQSNIILTSSLCHHTVVIISVIVSGSHFTRVMYVFNVLHLTLSVSLLL